jgi:hypothetical protein
LVVDFEHNGSILKITVRYRKVSGNHDAVRALLNGGTVQNYVGNPIVPAIQDLSMVSVNSFFQLDDGELAYVVSIASDGTCLCKEAQGKFPQDFILPYNIVSEKIRLYRLAQLNRNN